ncbi:hypothetical protein [Streptomyces carpinensis]|uniref:hypothetical protein n=1 Tax=Streptomyces carpinensis TaxID=66369 RepID=UPI000A3C6BD8|nr:hypothetical protein [Streptomyces carpinensis]
MTDDLWAWDYAFHAEDEDSYPKTVRDEVKALADQIVDLANLGIDPAELGEPTPGTARRHALPSGGWFKTQALPRLRPPLLAVVLVVPPPHLL